MWATVLFDEIRQLGFGRSYPTFTRGLRTHRFRPHCEPCLSSRGRDHAVIERPPGEEVQWDWLELPDPPAAWDAGGQAHLLVGCLPASGKWRAVLADAEDLPHLVEALHAVSARLGAAQGVALRPDEHGREPGHRPHQRGVRRGRQALRRARGPVSAAARQPQGQRREGQPLGRAALVAHPARCTERRPGAGVAGCLPRPGR